MSFFVTRSLYAQNVYGSLRVHRDELSESASEASDS